MKTWRQCPDQMILGAGDWRTCAILHLANSLESLATPNSTLCAKERIAIHKQSKSNPQLLIISDNDTHGVCRHRPHFHRHAKQITQTLMSLPMTKRPAHHMKLPHTLSGAMFAQLTSSRKHCEDQQKEILFHLFPEHMRWKQFQQFATNHSLCAVQHEIKKFAKTTNP